MLETNLEMIDDDREQDLVVDKTTRSDDNSVLKTKGLSRISEYMKPFDDGPQAPTPFKAQRK